MTKRGNQKTFYSLTFFSQMSSKLRSLKKRIKENVFYEKKKNFLLTNLSGKTF